MRRDQKFTAGCGAERGWRGAKWQSGRRRSTYDVWTPSDGTIGFRSSMALSWDMFETCVRAQGRDNEGVAPEVVNAH